MIESISVNNYKAFREARFDIKPITVFLGENSVGKSSILQLLLLLKQTALVSLFNENSPLKLNGYFAKMGLANNLFHNKDVSQPMQISIKYTNDKIGKKVSALLNNYIVSVASISYFLPIRGLLDWRNENARRSMDRNLFYNLVNKLVNVLSNEKLDRYLANLEYAVTRDSLLAMWDIQNLSVENFMQVYDMLTTFVSKVKDNDEYTVSYTFGMINNKLVIRKLCIETRDSLVFSFEKQGSDYLIHTIEKHIPEYAKKAMVSSFRQSKSIFECFDYPYNKQESKYETALSNNLLKIVEYVLQGLKEEFDLNKMNHVGPLRASPKRYYVLDKENYSAFHDCSDGEAIVELLKNDTNISQRTNKWLEQFGFNVGVEESEDIIHRLLVTQHDLTLDITDVGFGVSQILPIIVQGFLAKSFSLTIIEQPEIHLHPRMQANLANLFVDIVSYKDRNLIIESHSEYMLRRLRCLMANPDFKDIMPTEVAIYYFDGMDMENGKDYVSVKNLAISETGAFEWPKSFYETEMNDNINFMKFQQF